MTPGWVIAAGFWGLVVVGVTYGCVCDFRRWLRARREDEEWRVAEVEALRLRLFADQALAIESLPEVAGVED